MRAITYVEIDVDYCGHTYGNAPCTAAIGVTGEKKCFNGQKTCQDLANFDFDGTLTLRFAKPTADLPPDIPAIPSLRSVSLSPATISFGENLGQRAALECTFEDHPDSDTSLDKYYAGRGFDPYRQGTFWAKFRARFPYLTGKAIRVYRGRVGQTLAQMTVQHFVIDKTEGPKPDGTFSITARDMLKLADNEKAQAPKLSNGSLLADITAAATAIVVNPVGIGNLDYDGDGYLAIAGKEVVSFTRDVGADAPCVLLLHCDGANNTYVFTDSGPSAHIVTTVGGAVISTAQSVFGGASASFAAAAAHITLDGSDDFDFGVADFTVEFRARFVAVNARQVLFDMEPQGGGPDDYMAILLRSDGFLAVETNGVQRLASLAALVVNTWYHVMVSKRANMLRLFIGGVLQNAVKELGVFGTGVNRPVFGTRGSTTAHDFFGGFLDEIRIVNGRGMKTANFTIPAAAYASGVGDNITIVRAQFGTTAVAHTNQDRVQPCVHYSQMDPALILLNLFEQYGGIDRAHLPAESWLAETAAYLQRFYTTLIPEPTGVSILASELIEQANLAVWWDDVLQRIQLQVLRGIPTDTDAITADNRSERSFSSSEQLDKRVSQVWTYFGIINPLKSSTDADNYRSCAATVNLELETFYGSPAIRKIFSRWIPAFGRSIALEVNNILLTRYQIPPRKFSFELQREGGLIPELGGGYQLTGPFLQDDEGKAVSVPIRINRLGRTDDKYQIEAEEVFGGVGVGDLNNRTVIIDRDTFNANLRTLHDAIYPAIVDPTGITLTLIIEEGVKVGSTNAANPSLTIGTFPVGLPITVINKGRIGGKGGNGQGSDGQATGSGANGQAGGTALYTRHPITIDNTDGEIWGGGGSGGTSRSSFQSGTVCFNYNLVGGGGAGVSPGTTGTSVTTPSRVGTTEEGGPSATVPSAFGGFVRSGKGGDPGMPGLSGSFQTTANCPFGFNWTPGAAGKAIDGLSYITFTGAGSRKGPETG